MGYADLTWKIDLMIPTDWNAFTVVVEAAGLLFPTPLSIDYWDKTVAAPPPLAQWAWIRILIGFGQQRDW